MMKVHWHGSPRLMSLTEGGTTMPTAICLGLATIGSCSEGSLEMRRRGEELKKCGRAGGHEGVVDDLRRS